MRKETFMAIMDKKLYKYLKEVLEQPDGSSKKEQITSFRKEML